MTNASCRACTKRSPAAAADSGDRHENQRRDGGEGLSPARQKLSDAGMQFFKRISRLTVSDPMSGFFMVRRRIVADVAPRLSSDGFKILADILFCAPRDLRVIETPYVFRKRQAGEDPETLSPLVAMDFLGLLVHHASAGVTPIRWCCSPPSAHSASWCISSVLKLLLTALGSAHFEAAQFAATLTAMTSNFLLNNEVTYREYRYRGARLAGGLALFALVCSVGVVVNIDIAAWLFNFEHVWWVAGCAGALVGVVWNYAVSASFVWRRRRGA